MLGGKAGAGMIRTGLAATVQAAARLPFLLSE